MIEQKKIQFTNSKGDKLVGLLSVVKKDSPVVVMCHGFNSHKNSDNNVRMRDSLNSLGVSTFGFDFFGHGESEGNFADITISEAVDDCLHAIDYVKSQGFAKIGLYGSSFGGLASVLTAAQMPDLLGLVLRSPVSEYLGTTIAAYSKAKISEWKDKGFIDYYPDARDKARPARRLNYSFFEAASQIDVFSSAAKIKAPTLIVHGDKDEVVPVVQSLKLAKFIPGCQLEIVKGANHRYTDAGHNKIALDLITGFIRTNTN